jgi:hypothetical protein
VLFFICILKNPYLSLFVCFVGFLKLMLPGCTAACRLIAQPEILDVPTCTTRCPALHNGASDPNSERWNTNLGFLYTPQICDMGQDGFASPTKWKACWEFFFSALKNPTASAAGLNPRTLGTKCQYATSRAPKPHWKKLMLTSFFLQRLILPAFPNIVLPSLITLYIYMILYSQTPTYTKLFKLFSYFRL